MQPLLQRTLEHQDSLKASTKGNKKPKEQRLAWQCLKEIGKKQRIEEGQQAEAEDNLRQHLGQPGRKQAPHTFSPA